MHCMIHWALCILPSLHFSKLVEIETESDIHLLYQLQKTGNLVYWWDCPTNLINSERKKGITLCKALLLCISLEDKTTKFLKTSWVSNCLY